MFSFSGTSCELISLLTMGSRSSSPPFPNGGSNGKYRRIFGMVWGFPFCILDCLFSVTTGPFGGWWCWRCTLKRLQCTGCMKHGTRRTCGGCPLRCWPVYVNSFFVPFWAMRAWMIFIVSAPSWLTSIGLKYPSWRSIVLEIKRLVSPDGLSRTVSHLFKPRTGSWSHYGRCSSVS